MITVIMPDPMGYKVKSLQRIITLSNESRRSLLRERIGFINHLKDFKDMADLPEDHAVSKLLRLEQDDEV